MSLVSTGFIITNKGIIAIQGSPSALAQVGKQLGDDVVNAAAQTGHEAMSAVELSDLAKSSIEAGADSNPTLGSIKVVGSTAFGTAVGIGASPFVTPLGGAVVGYVAGKFYEWLFDRVRSIEPNPWTGESGGDPILSPEERNDIPPEEQVSVPFISPDGTNTDWRTALTPPPRDPLAIDLDADGIETLGIPTDGSSPVLFDHNANGIKTGTGWLTGDDAWLVRDLDGNGSIDSGRELFGVDTVITATGYYSNGTPYTYTRRATSGFEALRTLDENGDSVFNASDSAFTQVKLWQDLNRDGISQASELFTLADKGIASISLNETTATTNLGNGNSITGTAVVTRSNGSTTAIDSVDLTAGNLNLADNPFYREFTDEIPLTEAALALPEMGASGWVRDMREAMSLGTEQAQAFTDAVSAFAQANTADDQKALLDDLLTDWAKTTGRYNGSSMPYLGGSIVSTYANGDPREVRYTTANPGVTTTIRADIRLGSDSYYTVEYRPIIGAVELLTAEGAEVMRRIAVLEAFNGSRFIDFLRTLPPPGQSFPTDGGSGGGAGTVGGTAPSTQTWDITISTQQIEFVNRAYEALENSVYNALVMQTRLKPYLDAVELVIDETGIHFDTTAVTALLETTKTADERKALTDLIDLNRLALPTLDAVGFDGLDLLRTWIDALPVDSPLRGDLSSWHVMTSQAISGTSADEVYLGSDDANAFNAGAGDDIVSGAAGNDDLRGDDGDDQVVGGEGNDELWGGRGNDRLNGGAGDDVLRADSGIDTLNGGDGSDTLIVGSEASATLLGGAGNDTLQADNAYWTGANTFEGGTGNDVMRGGHNADTYRFNLGDGQDSITDQQWYKTGGFFTDRLVFGPGIDPSDITVTRSGNHLVFSHANGSDQVTVQSWFAKTDGEFFIEQVAFADGTTWTAAELSAQALVVSGTEAADAISGTVFADTMYGLGGNDTLTAVGYGDTLDGGDGSDTLNVGTEASATLLGGAGNDTLQADYAYWTGANTFEGGTGNDVMRGGHNADTYRFNLGDGQDSITDQQWYKTGGFFTDRLVFGAGIDPSDITVTRSGNHLVFSHANGSDQVTVQSWFAKTDGEYFIEQVAFADGTTWTAADLTAQALVTSGTEAADAISGTVFADTMYGLGGNDTLTAVGYGDTLDGGDGSDTLNVGTEASATLLGGAGNDTLQADYAYWTGANTFEGGTGNDVMRGGHNADTYRFNLGDGQDSITDQQWYKTGGFFTDRLVFGAGIDPSDITVTRSGNHLVFSHANGSDQVTVQSWFAKTDGEYFIEQVAFADGTTWTAADLTAQALVVSGTEAADAISGTVFADTMYGLGGNDTLTAVGYGDTLDGGDGSDTLNVGTEASATLLGGAGNDTLQADYAYWTGANTFEGGTGNDVMRGGHNADTYRFNLGDGQDSITDQQWYKTGGFFTDRLVFGAGIDPSDITVTRSGNHLVFSHANGSDQVTVQSWFAKTDGEFFIEQVAFADGTVWTAAELTTMALVVNGTEAADTISGTVFTDTLHGLGGNDTLTAVGYGDTLDGGDGSDTLTVGSDASATLLGGAGNDTLQADYAYWTGANTFEGGTGNDVMRGGHNADTYRFNLGDGQDSITDQQWYKTGGFFTDRLVFGAGIDPSDITVTRSGNHLVFSHANGSDQVTVQSWFAKTDGEFFIEQVAFADGTVWDTSQIAALTLNAINGTANPDTLTGTASADWLQGQAGADTLEGGDGHDRLDGGTGDDTLRGGAGDDVYEVDAAADTITENASEGTDTVRSSASWTLGANVENLVLTGTAAIAATGNALANRLTGNDAANRLDGGQGADVMTGRGGDDVYVVDDAGDTVVELAGGGIDSVESSVSHALADQVENLLFTGTAAINGTGNSLANLLTGNSANNTLTGGAGNDTLDGQAGADTMIGGTGDDWYVIDASADVVTEAAGEGRDGVRSTVSLTLAANVEDALLLGSQNLMVNGNALDNHLVGNGVANTLYGFAGNDTLDGGAGIDSHYGGAGDDTYVVEVSGDKVFELANEGVDTIQSYVSWSLGANCENLTLLGTDAINASGSSLGNVLTGNTASNTLMGYAGDDTLIGGGGADTLNGGTGHDTFVVDSIDDVVVEAASQTDGGNDTVLSSVSWTLGWHTENLVLTGSVALDGTGNELANTLTGNAAANTLSGLTGNDTLDGAGGNDTLIGGTGADVYRFGNGYGLDTVQENDATSGVVDALQFGAGIGQSDLAFARVGNNLEAVLSNGADKIVVKDWYLGSRYHVEEFRFADGSVLLDSQVEALVSAMAGFAAPSGGESSGSTASIGVPSQQLAANALA
ncbi:calcium-binding protein [Caldimonas sp. KR1-144]|uniref:calcium-binding protein n=1 Tax=Caldimonas sp. KR1-144 TaxID=3400911 RepID=UPI003C01A521